MSQDKQSLHAALESTLKELRRRATAIDLQVVVATRRSEEKNTNPAPAIQPSHRQTNRFSFACHLHKCDLLCRTVFKLNSDGLDIRKAHCVKSFVLQPPTWAFASAASAVLR